MKWIIVCICCALSASANAAVSRWNFEDARLTDGSAVTGFFDFDPDSGFFYPFLQVHGGSVREYDIFNNGRRYHEVFDEDEEGLRIQIPIDLRLAYQASEENWAAILGDPRKKVPIMTLAITNELHAASIWGVLFETGYLDSQSKALSSSLIPEEVPLVYLLLGLGVLAVRALKGGRLLPSALP